MARGGEFRLTPQAIVFLVVMVIEFLAIVGLTVLWTISNAPFTDANRDVYVFSFLLVAVSIFFLYFGINGVYWENEFDLMSYILASCLLCGYCGYEYFESQKTTFTLIRFCVSVTSCPINLVLGILVFKELGWRAAKTLGTADVKMLSRYRWLQIFFAMVKFDFMLGIMCVTIAAVYIVEGRELYLDIGAMVVTAGWVAIATLGSLYESTLAMGFFFLLALLEPAYIAFKMYEYISNPGKFADVSQFAAPIVVLGSMAILMRIVVVLTGAYVTKNFGKGLRDKLISKKGYKGLESRPFTQNYSAE